MNIQFHTSFLFYFFPFLSRCRFSVSPPPLSRTFPHFPSSQTLASFPLRLHDSLAFRSEPKSQRATKENQVMELLRPPRRSCGSSTTSASTIIPASLPPPPILNLSSLSTSSITAFSPVSFTSLHIRTYILTCVCICAYLRNCNGIVKLKLAMVAICNFEI